MEKAKLGFDHPCFCNDDIHVARMHLAVAPKCNIVCGFCRPTVDACAHGCAPGITARVLRPFEAVEHVRNVMAGGVDIRIVGIAGPGEPLFNPETFETVALLKAVFPHVHVCLSTNGLLLPQNVKRIAALGVETLTVTVNAVSLETGMKIYKVHGETPQAGVGLLMQNQLEGIAAAAAQGLVVKVNTVYVPGVNDAEVPEVARKTKQLGAYIHNVLPVIPRGDFAHLPAPDAKAVLRLQQQAGAELEQFVRCRHCRADAIVDADGCDCGE